ncbi:hypothetical protein ABH920_001917 [Catenulispora sp. EB89]
MNSDQRAKRRTDLGAVHTMPTRDEIRDQQPTATSAPGGPGAVPRVLLTAGEQAAHVVPESCVNFTLPGGGAVLMTVPTALSKRDALFAASIVRDFLTSLAERMNA